MALTRTVICEEGHLYDAREPSCPICHESGPVEPVPDDDMSGAMTIQSGAVPLAPDVDDESIAMTIQSESVRAAPEVAFDEDFGGATIVSPPRSGEKGGAAVVPESADGADIPPPHEEQVSKLTCLDGPLAGTELPVEDEGLLCIGSDPYNDLIVPHKVVGARHLLLDAQRTTVGLRVRAFDLDSAGGTWLNSLAPNGKLCAPAYLRRGDVVYLGGEVRISVS